ncbi:MAG: ankyrin repeat domain-containing protein [Oligoflexia bacterium]|nr:ankyrin repeat domain-containing protein [Oligoflexia bacterium]
MRESSTGNYTSYPFKGYTAVMTAAEAMDLKMVMYLLDKGARADIVTDEADGSQQTLDDIINGQFINCNKLKEIENDPFKNDNKQYSRENCNTFYSDYLTYLEKYVDNRQQKTNTDLTLIKAARAGDYNRVKEIVESYKTDPKKTPCSPDKVGSLCAIIWDKDSDLKSALYYAVLYNHVSIAKCLLQNGAGMPEDELTRAMLVAANNRKQSMVALLLLFDSDIDVALLNAAGMGLDKAVDILVENGANVKFSLNGITPLRAALKNGHKETAAKIRDYKKKSRHKNR